MPFFCFDGNDEKRGENRDGNGDECREKCGGAVAARETATTCGGGKWQLYLRARNLLLWRLMESLWATNR